MRRFSLGVAVAVPLMVIAPVVLLVNLTGFLTMLVRMASEGAQARTFHLMQQINPIFVVDQRSGAVDAAANGAWRDAAGHRLIALRHNSARDIRLSRARPRAGGGARGRAGGWSTIMTSLTPLGRGVRGLCGGGVRGRVC